MIPPVPSNNLYRHNGKLNPTFIPRGQAIPIALPDSPSKYFLSNRQIMTIQKDVDFISLIKKLRNNLTLFNEVLIYILDKYIANEMSSHEIMILLSHYYQKLLDYTYSIPLKYRHTDIEYYFIKTINAYIRKINRVASMLNIEPFYYIHYPEVKKYYYDDIYEFLEAQRKREVK